ncbi:carboxypeptidase 2 [Plectosphaerella cucumerina]|uniref:Carboxypeptidase M14B n=1 Tax=Plectosphaerella cucumerina TaxID=40658 RepID=A0A8K0TSU6_9PEZI|nr:carboxypeptidase 2 [Plectosphaerella cucumerina]
MRVQALALALVQAGVACAQAYADNQLSLQQDPPLVDALFPDVPDIELLSPAFADPSSVPDSFAAGTSGPTDIAVLDKFLQDIASRHAWATYDNALESEELRPIPYLRLSSSSSNCTAGQKVRIWLQGGVHGNEPGGDQALLALLGLFDANSTYTEHLLAKTEIVVLPRYNPDGVAYFQRAYASNFDPNRDQAVLKSRQSRDVKRVLSAFDPHVFLDAHEYTGGQRLGAAGNLRKAQDGQISNVKNPNIHESIRALGEGLFASSITATLEGHGLRTSPYFTAPGGTDNLVLTEPSSVSRPNHNNAGLLQAVAFLSETRGIRQGAQHFQRRVTAGLLVAQTIVETAAENAREVLDTIESGRAAFIESTDDIIVNDTARVHETTWEFINAQDGTLVHLPVTFHNSTPTIPDLTRARPEAYVFPRAFSEVAERLRVSGVEVEELTEPFDGEVEVLRVTRATVDSAKYEGIAETNVETEPFRKRVRIPAGGYRVSTRQKNAAFALVTLEPENRSSYARYNLVDLVRGAEYPIFRVL